MMIDRTITKKLCSDGFYGMWKMILLNAHCQIDLHSSVWQRAYT